MTNNTQAQATPKILALKVYPGGRVERRFARPEWLEGSVIQAAERLCAGAAIWIDPEDYIDLVKASFILGVLL